MHVNHFSVDFSIAQNYYKKLNNDSNVQIIEWKRFEALLILSRSQAFVKRRHPIMDSDHVRRREREIETEIETEREMESESVQDIGGDR